MNWKKITHELHAALGSKAKLSQLAMCSDSQITAIMDGRAEPSYSLGDRLIRMHDSMKESRRAK